MNKYADMLASILQTAGKFGFTDNTKIKSLFADNFTETDWIFTVLEYQLVCGRDIPDELAQHYDYTIKVFCAAVKQLPEIPQDNFFDYIEITARLCQAVQKRVDFLTGHLNLMGSDSGTKKELSNRPGDLQRHILKLARRRNNWNEKKYMSLTKAIGRVNKMRKAFLINIFGENGSSY